MVISGFRRKRKRSFVLRIIGWVDPFVSERREEWIGNFVLTIKVVCLLFSSFLVFLVVTRIRREEGRGSWWENFLLVTLMLSPLTYFLNKSFTRTGT